MNSGIYFDMNRILIAEDDDLVRMVIKDALEKKGFEVVESDDGDIAVEMFARYPDIGLLILDLNMNRMNGKEAYGIIKKMKPDLKCIVSSGHIEEGDKEELSEMGINAFLLKPYPMDDLYRTIGGITGSPV